MGYTLELAKKRRTFETYEEIVLTVPCVKGNGVGELLELAVDIWIDSKFKMNHKYSKEVVHIVVLKARNISGGCKESEDTFFVLHRKDAKKLTDAIYIGKNVDSSKKTDLEYEKVCKEFYSSVVNDAVLWDLYNQCNNMWSKRVFYIDSLDDVLDKLNGQRKREKLEEKKKAEAIRLQKEKEDLEKRRESENRLAERRKEREASIIEKKTEITSLFDERGILKREELSNKDKMKHYGELRRLCVEILPELAEKGFRVETVAQECPEIVSLKTCEVFLDNWKRISRAYHSLQSGIEGEEKVKEVLALFDDRIKIISNYRWGCEHDFIVIAPTGIFTIEVKNLYGDYELTETGILKYVSDDGESKSLDIALQSKKHIETLRRNLKECKAFGEEIPLKEIICSANAEFTIKNSYPYLPVCYYNTVDKYIFDGAKMVLSEKKMNEIYDFLLGHQQPDAEYPIFMPKGEISGREEFVRTFSEIVVGIEYRKAMKK